MNDPMKLARIEWRNEPHEEGIVRSLDGGIILEGGSGFIWPPDAGALPAVGDTVAIVGGWGYPFYGVAHAGRLVWWLTEDEREEREARTLARIEERQQREFVENEARLDEQYDALPVPLQARIRSLRKAGGREWRVHEESYEMFVCTEAAKIAERFGSPAEIDRWYRLSYDEQRAEWDGFGSGHSGNTFGVACSLAADLVGAMKSEHAVVRPAALSPISGDPRYS